MIPTKYRLTISIDQFKHLFRLQGSTVYSGSMDNLRSLLPSAEDGFLPYYLLVVRQPPHSKTPKLPSTAKPLSPSL